MGSHELYRMFDRLAPDREQEEAVLCRLLREERAAPAVRNRKKPARRITAAALAAVLMAAVVTCAAASSKLDLRLLELLGGTPEDETLLVPAAVEAGQVHTYESGWTVEISQVLADRLSLAVLVDITAPEGTVLSRNEALVLRTAQLDEEGNRISGGTLLHFSRQLEDRDPEDNHMSVLWQVRRTKGAASLPCLGGSLRVIPGGVRFREGDRSRLLPFEPEAGGWDSCWSCTVKLPEKDPGITYSLDRPLSVGSAQVHLLGAYVSPLGLTVYLEDPDGVLRAPEGENPEEWEAYWALRREMNWVDNTFLCLTDGRQLSAAMTQGTVVGRSCTLCFDSLLDPAEVESVTLFGQTFSLKQVLQSPENGVQWSQ